jgi:ComF family protein
LCVVCGIPFQTSGGGDHRCGRCLQHPPHYRRARACAVYETNASTTGPLPALIQRYKYNREVSLAAALGRLLWEQTPLPLQDYDLIVPVPLHTQRLRWRGFNQALLLARRLAGSADVAVEPFALRRTRPTRPQVELDESERKHNVRHAFGVTQPARLRRRRILLIDDVMTTGATVDECARELLDAGVHAVDVLVLARAVPS